MKEEERERISSHFALANMVENIADTDTRSWKKVKLSCTARYTCAMIFDDEFALCCVEALANLPRARVKQVQTDVLRGGHVPLRRGAGWIRGTEHIWSNM
jgi:hypothetical protein